MCVWERERVCVCDVWNRLQTWIWSISIYQIHMVHHGSLANRPSIEHYRCTFVLRQLLFQYPWKGILGTMVSTLNFSVHSLHSLKTMTCRNHMNIHLLENDLCSIKAGACDINHRFVVSISALLCTWHISALLGACKYFKPMTANYSNTLIARCPSRNPLQEDIHLTAISVRIGWPPYFRAPWWVWSGH